MFKIFENKYSVLYRHDDIKAYEQQFKPEAANLFGDEFISEMRTFGERIEKQQTESRSYGNLIVNTIHGGPIIEQEVQEWMHNTFFPYLSKIKIDTKAYCLGEEIIAKLSIELTAENESNKIFKFKFFSSLEDGIEWLKIQNL